MTALADIKKLLAHASPEELAEIDKLLAADPWSPLPGPQMMAYDSEADITGYGGAAGGGKTDLLAGLVLTRHKRALIVRREKAQTEGVVQRLEEIIGNKDGFNSQKAIWKLDSDTLVEFAGLDNPGDERRWQGRPHDLKCVGAGTPIWMADGSLKPIEEIAVGDYVFTLQGPKRVTRTMQVTRPAIRIKVEGYEQVQAADHAVLAFLCRCEPASPTGCRCAPLYDGKSVWTSLYGEQLPEDRQTGRPTGSVSRRGDGTLRSSSETCGDAERIGQESDCEANCGSPPDREPQVSLRRAGLVLLSPPPGLGVSGTEEQQPSRGGRGALAATSLPDYPSEPRCDGGQLHPCGEGGQQYQHRRAGVVQQSPTCLPEGALRQTPTRSLRKWSWDHPYRTGTCETDHPARVVQEWSCDYMGECALFDLTVEDANHYVAGPGIVNRNCFDEATEMREAQVRFVMGWTRSSDPSVRPRVVMTFNPPTTAEGRWVIKFFAPWLDRKHPNPAKPGELRWFTTKGDDQDFEVPDGRTFVFGEDGELIYDFDPDEHPEEKIIVPKSRTFIPARLTDNPYYMETGYMSTLQSLPEPLRSQMLNGDFMAGVEDNVWQVIPTRWVEIAQARWKALDVKPEMTSIGVDVARGGKDSTVIARRHGWWFDELQCHQGEDTDNGPKVMALTLAAQRDQAPIHLDVIGVGASPYDYLVGAKAQVYGVNVGAGSVGTDKTGRLTFKNLRSELWWKMRELLDPGANNGIALPPDPALLADLCAPLWKPQGKEIKVESREEIIKRIQRSPDRASAVILCAIDTPKWSTMQAVGHSARDYDPYREMAGVQQTAPAEYNPLNSYR